MKNNKGLTLVELLAVLTVLSIIALIVTPNIYKSIRDYRNNLYDVQIQSIKSAAKNWAADHITDSNFPNENKEVLQITLGQLQDNGYINSNLKNIKDGGSFSKDVFITITSYTTASDETSAANYIYTYDVYLTVNDYLKYAASLWAKANINTNNILAGNSYTTTVLVSDLIAGNYMSANVKDPATGNSIDTAIDIEITCTATETNSTINYTYTYVI